MLLSVLSNVSVNVLEEVHVWCPAHVSLLNLPAFAPTLRLVNFSHQELNLRLERLHNQVTKKKKLLDNEMIESITAQIELDKTAECFRTAHQEREQLIEQWEQTIHQMRKRDLDMDKCSNVRSY